MVPDQRKNSRLGLILTINIIDIGLGNIRSIEHWLEQSNLSSRRVTSPSSFPEGAIVIPGVSSVGEYMRRLKKSGLDKEILERADKGQKIIGICLGFQMLAESSEEDGITAGLGFIPASVESFSAQELEGRKLPHIGFNQVELPHSSILFDGFEATEDFYFVHSYRLLAQGLLGKKAICNYGVDFLAAYEFENVFGAQFHPEKSQTNGLRLLANFLST